MKKIILIVLIAGMFGWAVYDFAYKDQETTQNQDMSNENSEEGQSNDSNEEAKVGLEKGNLAPNFELKTLSGETVQLSDYRGEKIMLNFWATWCPPCRAEMPDMEKFYNNEDVKILAVNLTNTEESQDAVKKFKKEFGLSFPILMDEKLAVANKYQIQPIPTSYMIDSNGKIQHIALGAMNYEMMVDQFNNMK
ncbi:peroxiredoxin family protein [Pontibacillus marinus]|uniref:Thioredoxin domain-containing protein n=1 Tax=Pontibacillus marinus BH030004 = DSM 16465 TaxID=1385511 RepID=A0A0A5G1C6_9BACI|nr:redoxin domain-containing protein [Pontibacillus marinus]KGX84870.1 hypothetical protein N783_15785 [Pontibacillus marinus BH030004 = DSM 16465]